MDLPIFISNKPILDAANMSTSLQSSVENIGEASGYAVHSIFSGSPIGTLTVLGSNSENPSNFVIVDTYEITTSGKRLFNVEKVYYKYVMVVYTRTSGTGSITSYLSTKRS